MQLNAGWPAQAEDLHGAVGVGPAMGPCRGGRGLPRSWVGMGTAPALCADKAISVVLEAG